MELFFTDIERATTVTVIGDDTQQRVIASIPKMLEGPDSPIREQAINFRAASTSYAALAAGIVGRFTPVARGPELRSAALKTLAGPTQSLIAAGQAEARAAEAARQRMLSVPVVDTSNAMLRHDYRTAFTAMQIGEKAALIEHGSFDQLAAIMEAGRTAFVQLPDEIWNRIENRYLILHHIRLTGISANYQQQSSLEHPLAIGVDQAVVERAAEQALAGLNKRSEFIEVAEQAIHGMTTVVALSCDMQVSDAFNLLTGRAAS